MSFEQQIIKERFDVSITGANQSYRTEFELDKNAKYLLGIAITSDREDLLFYRGSQKIQLNDKELFPEDFESKLLLTGLNVNPNKRVVLVGEIETGNGRIDLLYKDSNHTLAPFTPYRFTIYTFSIIQKFEDSKI